MKKFKNLILSIFSVLFISCNKENPKAIFSTDFDTYTERTSISFFNESEGDFSYYWDFGDGGSSLLKNPNHTYIESGDYTVTLQVKGAKKTEPSEFSKAITILDLNYIEPDTKLGNTTWVCDSITHFQYSCHYTANDYSTNEVDETISFTDDFTLISKNVTQGERLQEYILSSDTTISTYRNTSVGMTLVTTWSFKIDGERLTLTNYLLSKCKDSDLNKLNGQVYAKHYFLSE